MKILIVSRGIPDQCNKMNGIFEWDQARTLKKMGIDVAFAVLDMRSIRHRRKLSYSQYVRDGIPVYVSSLPVGAIPAQWFVRIGSGVFEKLYKRIEGDWGRPDIIHAHFTQYACIALGTAQRFSLPLVMTEHSTAVRKIKLNSAYGRCIKNMYASTCANVCVGNALAELLREKFSVQAQVIGNVIETDVFADVVTRRKPHANFTVVSVGNLIDRKRMNLLIRAFERAIAPLNGRLLIFGDGPQRESLEQLIDNLQLTDRVFLCGLCSRKEIARAYQSSDCFALVSEYETYGVVIAEALSAGLPVIATRCGGPEDFVNEQNGVLIDVDDEQALENALLFMYRNSSKYLPETLSRMIDEQFSAEKIGQKLLMLYTTILEEKK